MFLGPAALILETIRLCNVSEWLGSTLGSSQNLANEEFSMIILIVVSEVSNLGQV